MVNINNKALIVLAKYPRVGKVKTRLAKSIGAAGATNLYKEILHKLILQVDQLEGVDIFLCFASGEDKTDFINWLGKKIFLLDFFSDDVEINLNHAFEKLFIKRYKKIISIASDVPDINNELIYESFKLLEDSDVVIGPDAGGGIYLYGEKIHHHEFFQNKHRQNASIFTETLHKAKQKNLKIYVQKKLIDIDTVQDLDNWQKSVEL